ncbi:MAG: tetratricopeptide repeat protein [SAR324 cluster bacterium]|nr:tetratricopeptide repeat protein [SAR324 cluster bacterium]
MKVDRLRFSQKSWTVLTGFWLTALTLVGYSRSLKGPFVFDDFVFILNNSAVQDLPYLLRQLQLPFSSGRAVSLLSFYCNHLFDGFEVEGYHFFNLLLHSANSLLLFLMLIRLQNGAVRENHPNVPFSGWDSLIAFVTASLFAVHPLLSSTVLYITQRSSQLVTMFTLLAFMSYLQARCFSPKLLRFWTWSFLCLLFYWLAFKSKNMALTGLGLPLIHEGVLATASGRFRQFLKRGSIGILILGWGIGTYFQSADYLLKGNAFLGFNSDSLWGPWTHFQTMTRVLMHYWKLLMLPLPQWLSIDHDFSISPGYADPWAISAIGAHLIIITVMVLFARNKFVLAALGIGWFYLTLGPYLVVPQRDLFVEYKLYLPSIGYFLITADLLRILTDGQVARIFPPAAFAIFSIVIIAGTAGIWQRSAAFSSGVALWKDAVSKAPVKDRALYNLGNEYSKLEENGVALIYYQKALQVNIANNHARLNMARLYSRMKRYEDALVTYHQILTTLSNYRPENLGKIPFQAFSEAARLHSVLRQWEKAIPLFHKAIEWDPQHSNIYAELGRAYAQVRQPENAIFFLNQALTRNSQSFLAHYYLGGLLGQMGKPEAALKHLRIVTQLEPENPDHFNNLGIVYRMLGNYHSAQKVFRQALKLNPNHPQAQENLISVIQLLPVLKKIDPAIQISLIK